MIKKVRIENFKKFEKAEIFIDGLSTLFVGQNNGGKTTALQAISLWSFLIQQWREKKGKGQAKKRTGAPISRSEVYAAPVRDTKTLWTNGIVREKGEVSKNVIIKIIVDGETNGEEWSYGMELVYSNQEQFICKPCDHTQKIPPDADKIFHLPPLSGVQTEEKRIDRGAQLRAIGEGRPGEILRNLLLELHQNFPTKWNELTENVTELFAVKLAKIEYNSSVDPYISIFYESLVGDISKPGMKLEIANAGSGFLQFLLLASFMYVHEGAVLLIDEPDSHMHIFLQRGMYDWLQKIASLNASQLIISTHSEILVNKIQNPAEKIVGFFSKSPLRINIKKERLIDALREVSPLAIVNAEWKQRIFFAEGESDLQIIKAWAGILQHPVVSKLKDVFFKPVHNNDINFAKTYYKALKSVVDESKLKGLCLLDDDPGTAKKDMPPDFEVRFWSEKEIENYLIIPEALIRFAENPGTRELGNLFGASRGAKAREYLNDNLNKKFIRDSLNQSIAEKGSDFLEIFFKELGLKVDKGDYWEIAQGMKKEEIKKEIIIFLDDLEKFLL